MQTKPKFALYTLAAVIAAACLMLALEAPGAARAQAQGVDYDADNDGLISINYLEQLDAVHYDLNGDGAADSNAFDPDAAAAAYVSAFPNAAAGMGCPDGGCKGYELDRSLDFNNPASYAANAVRADWTSGGGWFPIGVRDFEHSFLTTFDGNNNTISNLFIDDDHHEPDMVAEIAALFGRNEGTIRNIGVTTAAGGVTGHYDVGILAGYNHGRIENTWSAGASHGEHNVGGLVGENAEDAVITRSWSSAMVDGPTDVGGLVGSNGGSISFSYATGDVNGQYEVGGLVGESHRSLINNCYATGSVLGYEQVGGLIGRNDRANITLSYATGDVHSNGGLAGGLVGHNQGGIVNADQTGEISFSYATGDVSGLASAAIMGGLVGRANNSRIIASYATGDIPIGLNGLGGLAGAIVRTPITASYATGNIVGNDIIGGLVGINTISSIHSSFFTGSITIAPSPLAPNPAPIRGGIVGSDLIGSPANRDYVATYWDTDRGMVDWGAGFDLPRQTEPEGKTTAELQAPTGYTGIYAAWRADVDNADRDDDRATGIDDFWDFGTSSQYPALKADLNGDGVATWQEFGDQDRMPAPLPTPTPTPVPQPTPVTNEQVLGSLDGVMEALEAFRDLLNLRLGSDNGGGATPSPTPSATPVTSPSPVATPVTSADACVETLTLSDTVFGAWSSECSTDRVPGNATAGMRYARFYTFTLTQAATVTITLTAEDNPDTTRNESDTHLYLLDGAGRNGAVRSENDDIDTAAQNYGSRISESLPVGSYTIVATTFYTEQEGDFTLEALASVGASTQ